MKKMVKIVTGLVSFTALCLALLFVFGDGKMRLETAPLVTAYAFTDTGTDLQADEQTDAEENLSVESAQPDTVLLPYAQPPSRFADMDMQYAFLILQQGLERSYLKDNAELTLENDNEFVITCWSDGMGLEITEGLADNETRLNAWKETVDTLWEMDAIFSRDIKETLGTDKSVTIRIVDDVHPEAVLLKIKDGRIEYNLFRDGNSPKYEVYGQ